MKQLIIINQSEFSTLTDMLNVVSEASMAFMKSDFLECAYPYEKYDAYDCVDASGLNRKVYTNPILDELSYNHYMLGHKKFYIKETYQDGKLIAAEEVDDILCYECVVTLDQYIYEEWMKVGQPKELYSLGPDMPTFQDVIHSLDDLYLTMYQDYFPIYKENKVVAVGLKPMDERVTKTLKKALIAM